MTMSHCHLKSPLSKEVDTQEHNKKSVSSIQRMQLNHPSNSDQHPKHTAPRAQLRSKAKQAQHRTTFFVSKANYPPFPLPPKLSALHPHIIRLVTVAARVWRRRCNSRRCDMIAPTTSDCNAMPMNVARHRLLWCIAGRVYAELHARQLLAQKISAFT